MISPPAAIEDSPSAGYRAGADAPMAEDGGHISAADLARAVLDEIESPAHVRQRFAVAH